MNIATYKEWESLLPAIAFKTCSDEERRRWYEQEAREGNLNKDEELYGYRKYEAFTYSGEDLFYIRSTCDGENCSDFFVEAVRPDYKIAAYDWYTKAALEKTFKRLGKSVFEITAPRPEKESNRQS